MSELAVITPTFRGDAEIFADLHRSVLEFTPPDTVHHVFVPRADRGLFAKYESSRCRVRTKSELMSPRYIHVGRGDLYLNVLRPWPPVRGWVTQQVIKIAAAAELDTDFVLLADSDVVFVRPVRAERFTVNGSPALYRDANGVTADMGRHIIWHQVAREMLGGSPSSPPPVPDYVSPLNFWQPEVVRAMQSHIHATTGRNWLDVFTAALHVSEFILYGVFVDTVLTAGGPQRPADITLCHNEWQRTPMDRDAALRFADSIGPDAIAMMISAQSCTPIEVRRAVIERCAAIVGSGGRSAT